jgi:lipooligosaccharide transport system permease protein
MYAGRPWVLLERGWIAFRSTNWIPVVTGFVEPVLFLLAFGYGMGNLVGDVTTGNTTMDYTLFIAPGLLANSAMNGAIYDSTWNVFWKLNESKLYKTMLSTPLGPLDIALGEITWALIRGLVYSLGFLTVVTALGLTPSFWAILAIPAASLVAFGFASFGMAITSYFKTYQQMGFINFVLLPMTLFSGSLYPISVYPDWLEKIIMASAAVACNRNGSSILVWKSNLRRFDSYRLLHSDDRYRTFRNFSQITRTVPSLIQTKSCIRY